MATQEPARNTPEVLTGAMNRTYAVELEECLVNEYAVTVIMLAELLAEVAISLALAGWAMKATIRAAVNVGHSVGGGRHISSGRRQSSKNGPIVDHRRSSSKGRRQHSTNERVAILLDTDWRGGIPRGAPWQDQNRSV